MSLAVCTTVVQLGILRLSTGMELKSMDESIENMIKTIQNNQKQMINFPKYLIKHSMILWMSISIANV